MHTPHLFACAHGHQTYVLLICLQPKPSKGAHGNIGAVALMPTVATAAPPQLPHAATVGTKKPHAASVRSIEPVKGRLNGSVGAKARRAPGSHVVSTRPSSKVTRSVEMPGGVSEVQRLTGIVAQQQAKMAAQALRIKGQLETIKQLQQVASHSHISVAESLSPGPSAPTNSHGSHGISSWLSTAAHQAGNMAHSEATSLPAPPLAIRPATALTSATGLGSDLGPGATALAATQRELQLLQALQEAHAKLKVSSGKPKDCCSPLCAAWAAGVTGSDPPSS